MEGPLNKTAGVGRMNLLSSGVYLRVALSNIFEDNNSCPFHILNKKNEKGMKDQNQQLRLPAATCTIVYRFRITPSIPTAIWPLLSKCRADMATKKSREHFSQLAQCCSPSEIDCHLWGQVQRRSSGHQRRDYLAVTVTHVRCDYLDRFLESW